MAASRLPLPRRHLNGCWRGTLLASSAAVEPTTRSREADVSFVRDQREPIRSRRSPAASYRREATLAGATGLACALRWLELGPDRP